MNALFWTAEKHQKTSAHAHKKQLKQGNFANSLRSNTQNSQPVLTLFNNPLSGGVNDND